MSDEQNQQSNPNKDKTSHNPESGEASQKKSAPEYPPATPPNQRTSSSNYGEGKSDKVAEF
jgi:hypothetical protein